MLQRNRLLSAISLGCGLALGVALSFVGPSQASRNSSGTYSLPSGTTVTSGTTIQPAWANTLTSDLATELTLSLDRNGRGAMLAPLQCSSGSVGAPSLTFSSDSDTGLFRIGANNLGITAGGVKVADFNATTAAFPLAVTTAKGLTATQSTTNTTALTATGNGSAAGLTGVGGATGAGVVGTGGATSGNGGTFTATGSGTNYGVRANGSAGTESYAVYGVAGTNNHAVVGTGNGTGAGVVGSGGATASGVIGAPGGSVTADTNTRYAFYANAGHIGLGGGNPASTTAFTNALTPANLVKAWGRIATVGNGTATVTAGFNIASVTCGDTGNDDLLVTMAVAATGTNNYAVFVNQVNATAQVHADPTSATVFRVHSGGGFACDTDVGAIIHVMVVGLQ